MRAALLGIWARRPLFVIAVALVCVLGAAGWGAGTGAGAGAGTGAGAAVGGGALLGWVLGWRRGLLSGLLGISVVANGYLRDRERAADEARLSGMGMREAGGRLLEDAVGEGGRWSGVAKLRGGEFGGVRVRWSGSGEPPPAGTELMATGTFRELPEERNPGAPDRARRMRDQGVAAVFRASEMRSRQWIGPVSALAAKVKGHFRRAIVMGLEKDGEAALVIEAVVMGEKDREALGLVRNFRESGTLHVFTVSGMHVMMLGSIAWFILKWCGVSRVRAIPVIIAAMWGYSFLTGNGQASMRAAWMGTLFLTAFLLRRRPDLLNAMGAVMVVGLLIDPRMIRDPGVQLSYGVVAAIGLGAVIFRRDERAEEEFTPRSERRWWERKRRLWGNKARTALGVSAAATIGSTPLSAWHFGLVTPISILATVAIVPLVYVLLLLALLAVASSPFSERAAGGVNRINGRVAGACAGVARAFAAVPWGSWQVRSPGRDTLVVFDLGYGAGAACFYSGDGNAVLIDTGGEFEFAGEAGPAVMRLGMRPDSAVLTHADGGHVVGPGVLRGMFPVGQVVSGVLPGQGGTSAGWNGGAPGEIRIFQPGRGARLRLGKGVVMEVLDSPWDRKAFGVADDAALVFRLEWAGKRLLWLGDAGRMAEERMIASGVDLRADVIVAGIHGSDLSLTEAFVRAVGPEVIIIPRAAGEDTDVLRAIRRRQWEAEGVRTMDQEESGGITATMREDGGLRLEGFLSGEQLAGGGRW